VYNARPTILTEAPATGRGGADHLGRGRGHNVVHHSIVDNYLYVESMERAGASDFMVPPFFKADVAHVLVTVLSEGQTASPAALRRATGEM